MKKNPVLATEYGREFPFREMMDILKEYLKDDVPVVTRISRDKEADPFLILVGTLLSLRTKDETTEKVMSELVKRVRTPQEMLAVPENELERILYPVGFYRNKARTLREVSWLLLSEYKGKVPDSIEELLKIKGVGRKTANLVITEAFHKPGICVDTHVHRISNRLGIVQTGNPNQTEDALRLILPTKYWIIYNTYLVSFGKRTCQPLSPLCSTCPTSHLCKKVGVTHHR
jgi:endonuclease III